MAHTPSVFTYHRQQCSHRKDRNYRRCGCPLWIHDPNAPRDKQRFSAKTNNYEEALQKAANLKLESGRATKDMTVATAIDLYLKKRSTCSDASKAPYKDRYLLANGSKTQLSVKAWAESKGFTNLNKITAAALDSWRDEWTFRAHSHSLKVHSALIKRFFTWAVKFDYLTKNPFDRLDPIDVVAVPTLPLEPEEFSKVLACVTACKVSDQARMTCFILLCRWSGLAIMDASCLKRNALGADNRLKTCRAKTGEFVYVKLPNFVGDMLRSHGNMHPDYFFWSPSRRIRESQVHWFEDRLRKIYDQAGITPRGCHRFRDTFAVEFLNTGGSIEDLAMLLGHSSIATTQKHYMPWVKSRQIRLDAAVEKSLAAQGINIESVHDESKTVRVH